MPEYRFKFKSNTKEEFNDVVYEGPPFSLTQMAYIFTILPQKTQFWRFGIRLSQTPDIPFFHPVHRHREGIIDIHLSVGEFDGEKWSLPNRFQLGQYHIANTEQITSRSDTYKPMSQVTWSIELLEGFEDQNFLALEYKAPGVTAFKNRVVIPATYKYFQLFAWSDKNEFELDCTITETHVPRRATGNEDSGRNYWLLKINPKSFEISEFDEGSKIWFGTHDTRFAQRQEYSLYFDVKKGDAVLGYASNPNNEIIWDMTVDLGIHSDKTYGECIKLSIDEVRDPGIPIDNFRSFLSPNVDQVLTQPSPIRLVPITQEVYLSILNSTSGVRRKKTGYYPSYITEGDHKFPDQLQLEYDIEALASVIALKEVNPPLAVGLFGNWGSGKSFFMEKLENKISAYAGTGEERYVRHVVPVRFNSWHYCDANLWASLITEIFESLRKFSENEGKGDELKKLVNTLQITSLQKEAALENQKKLEQEVVQLKQHQEEKRNRLEHITGIALVKIILSDKHVKSDLAQLNNDEIENIINDQAEIDRCLKEVNKGWNQAKFLFREVLKMDGWKWLLIIVTITLIFCIPYILTNVFAEQWKSFISWVSACSATVTIFGKRIFDAIKPWKQTIATAVERLTSLKNTIDARKVPYPPELTEKEKEIEVLRESVLELDVKIGQTRLRIEHTVSGKRLGDFIKQRSKDEQYVKGLGMISWIRKDFVTLDKLLREQYELDEEQRKAFSNPQDVKLQIDRIVLYIDDLDRCNEDVVVRVLEAIHLLLAFPLFVVIVGVDPRWLNNALNNKLGKLFSPTGRARQIDNIQPLGKAATSYDYLEKIFQIPFALKPIGKPGRERLIDYLMPAELVQSANPLANQLGSQDQKSKLNADDQTDIGDTRTSAEIPNDQSGGRIKLSFKAEELNFIKKVSVIFGQTPRSIKRFVNVYMIIKSHRSLVIKNSDNYNEYYPVIVLLAIVVGCSEKVAQFIKKVAEAGDHQTFGNFIGMTANDPNATDLKEMLLKYKDLFDPEVSRVSMADFKVNAELVSRFSFRQILQ